MRVAVLSLPDDRRPVAAERVWPGHPKPIAERAMASIGSAAARQLPVPPSARSAMLELARKDSFDPDPFLVEGTIAQTAARAGDAERLFEEARARNWRSAAARYFLADLYLRSGRIAAGLDELAALSRVVREAHRPLVPALAAYAATPGAVPRLRDFFLRAPAYRDEVLGALAADPANAELIIALAGAPGPGAGSSAWQTRIVEALLAKGEYARAQSVWRRLSGAPPHSGLFNPSFLPLTAPAPFNWTLLSGDAALVAATPSAGLELIYYGRSNAVLAGQTILLPPGAYRLATATSGAAGAGALRWVIRCLPDGPPIGQLPLSAAGARFSVPSQACRAQRVELTATATDDSRRLELRIARVAIGAEGRR